MEKRWPRGQMDKVSDYGSEDSRFESWRGRLSAKLYRDLEKHFTELYFNNARSA